MKVYVLGGGNSPEREVSLRSAKAVKNALIEAGFEVSEADPKDGYEVLEHLTADTIVFPILHGEGGEDGIVQTELERRGLAYLGSDSQVSKVCFNKWLTRETLKSVGLPVANGVLVNKDNYNSQALRSQPHVLKAIGGGSSIGTYIVRDPTQIDQNQVTTVFAVSEQAVLEELIEGVEITVPILDTTALPIIEIRPPYGGEFDYENKYNGTTQEICPAVSLNESVEKQVREIAEMTHRVLGCRHLSRVDMIIRSDNTVVILEINTMPGMTDQSLYPKSAKAAGIDFPELMKRFVKLVRQD